MKHPVVLLGCTATLVAFVQPVSAKTPAEIESIARLTAVEMISGTGSGVLIYRQGDLYTVVTNRHVVCADKKLCDESGVTSSHRLRTVDGQVYQVDRSAIKLLKDGAGNVLDLAIIQFRSSRSYAVAQMAESGSLKVRGVVYTAGFPERQGFLFGQGTVQAVVNKRLIGDGGGYTVIYNAEAARGMSGGGAFDQEGRLVAVHGFGDRYTPNTQARSLYAKAEVGSRIPYNRGIPVRWVALGLSEQGMTIGGQRSPQTGSEGAVEIVTADEFFVAGFNKWVDPGDSVQAGLQTAVLQFSRAIELNPNYAVAYFLRAYANEALGNYFAALADLNKAIALNPNVAGPYNNRGNLKTYYFNDFQGALADYNQAITISPNLAEPYNNRGLLKADKLNEPQGALADYNKAITINPNYAEAYNNRGALKVEKLNDIQGALADYNQAITVNPNYANAYSNRGNLKGDKLSDPQGGLADHNKAIIINPKFAYAYINRGNLKTNRLNELQSALADYNKAIALNPNIAEAYAYRGILKYKLDDSQGALTDFNKAIAINPNLSITYTSRGVLRYSKLNDYQGALVDLNKAIDLNQNDAEAYTRRGFLRDKLSDTQGALTDYSKAVSLNPTNAEAYNNRGNLKAFKLNDHRGALADLNQAITINPNLAEAYYNRGGLKYLKLNDTAGAIQDFRIAVKLFRSQGNTAKAQQILEVLRQLGATE